MADGTKVFISYIHDWHEHTDRVFWPCTTVCARKGFDSPVDHDRGWSTAGSRRDEEGAVKDFFVSYNTADRPWAEWIAWALEEAGYSAVIQAWDFRPGANFVLEMHKAAEQTQKTIVVLSENYLKAEFTQPEWAAAFCARSHGRKAQAYTRTRDCLEDLKSLV